MKAKIVTGNPAETALELKAIKLKAWRTKMDHQAQKNAHKLYMKAKASGVRQQDLAKKSGMTQGNFSNYILGNSVITPKVVDRLCLAFDCDPSDIRPEYSSQSVELLEIRVKELEKIAKDAIKALEKSDTEKIKSLESKLKAINKAA